MRAEMIIEQEIAERRAQLAGCDNTLRALTQQAQELHKQVNLTLQMKATLKGVLEGYEKLQKKLGDSGHDDDRNAVDRSADAGQRADEQDAG